MEKMKSLLQRGTNGNAVLFCGSGLTADCLNFDDDSTLGVTHHLLTLLNAELKQNGQDGKFKNIKNAAKRFKNTIGSFELMTLLQKRFKLSAVSASIIDIMAFPWATVFTTNYDNGIELAFQRVGKKFFPRNNLDNTEIEANGTQIIHLHGFADVWTSENFERSCVLDADSYHDLSAVKKWLNRLRFDIERAEVVVFIGFSAADFHLSEVFFNASGLREKAFFINPPSSSPDPDERATQEDFGEPLYIGREGFSQLVTETLSNFQSTEPVLASFRRYQPVQPSTCIPSVCDIEDLFIWGRVSQGQIRRDHELYKSDYHTIRNESNKILTNLEEGGKITLVSGDICCGKSIIIMGAMSKVVKGRPVFELRHPYDDLVNETSKILSHYQNAVLVVENCFSLHETRLMGLARQVASSSGNLILSTRSISTEGETSKIKALRTLPSLVEVEIGRLSPDETDALISLIDQIAGWRDFRALSFNERRRFVNMECNGILPSVFLKILNSEYVRDKYREEYNKTSYLSERDRQMIVAALLISNIGIDPPASFISDIFENDIEHLLRRMTTQNNGLKLIALSSGKVRTVPSIGARSLLRHIVDVRDVVNTTVTILENLSDTIRRSDFERHIFIQLMRYSILSSIVSNVGEINRFFDHISKIRYFREMPLFWLQWHMAMCAQKDWRRAKDYLDMGYNAADVFEKIRDESYNRKQLNDRKAKFLASRAKELLLSDAELFRDMKEAMDLVARLMRDEELSHHPFETLLEIVKVLQSIRHNIPECLMNILTTQSRALSTLAKSRLEFVPLGAPRIRSAEWLKQINTIVGN